MKEQLDKAKQMLEVQGQSGNWNYDPYMHGMYNGMEFVIACMEDREPKYRTAPDEWLVDKKIEGGIESTQEKETN